MKTTLINRIYRAIQARNNNEKTNNEWFSNWTDYLEGLNKYLPSGSGIDAGSKIDIENSTETRIIITFSYHFMNDNGYYIGWSDYKLILKPSFDGAIMKITGPDRRQIKDYLYSTFDYCLNEIQEFPNITT